MLIKRELAATTHMVHRETSKQDYKKGKKIASNYSKNKFKPDLFNLRIIQQRKDVFLAKCARYLGGGVERLAIRQGYTIDNVECKNSHGLLWIQQLKGSNDSSKAITHHQADMQRKSFGKNMLFKYFNCTKSQPKWASRLLTVK